MKSSTVVVCDAKVTGTPMPRSSATSLSAPAGANVLPSSVLVPVVMRYVRAATYHPVIVARSSWLDKLNANTRRCLRVACGSRIATCVAASGSAKCQIALCPGQVWLRLSATPPSQSRWRISLGCSTPVAPPLAIGVGVFVVGLFGERLRVERGKPGGIAARLPCHILAQIAAFACVPGARAKPAAWRHRAARRRRSRSIRRLFGAARRNALFDRPEIPGIPGKAPCRRLQWPGQPATIALAGDLAAAVPVAGEVHMAGRIAQDHLVGDRLCGFISRSTVSSSPQSACGWRRANRLQCGPICGWPGESDLALARLHSLARPMQPCRRG